MMLVNGCWFHAASGGTGAFSVASALTGYMTPAVAGAVDGGTYSYRASSTDDSQWEIGTGVYTASGTTLSRTVLKSSNADAAVNFSSAPRVALVAAVDDFESQVLQVATFDGYPSDVTFDVSGLDFARLEVVLVNCQKEIVENNPLSFYMDVSSGGDAAQVMVATGNQTSSAVPGISGSLFVVSPQKTGLYKSILGYVNDGSGSPAPTNIGQLTSFTGAVDSLRLYWSEGYGFEPNGGSIALIGHRV